MNWLKSCRPACYGWSQLCASMKKLPVSCPKQSHCGTVVIRSNITCLLPFVWHMETHRLQLSVVPIRDQQVVSIQRICFIFMQHQLKNFGQNGASKLLNWHCICILIKCVTGTYGSKCLSSKLRIHVAWLFFTLNLCKRPHSQYQSISVL